MVSPSAADGQGLEVPDMIREMTTNLLTPLLQPMLTDGEQPLPRAAVEAGIDFYETLKEALAATGETMDDLVAELRARMDGDLEALEVGRSPIPLPADPSLPAATLISITQELNRTLLQASGGLLDLRLLLPLSLGILALNQFLKQRPSWEEIPWNVLAWYAFDSFLKFNQPAPAPSSTAPHPVPPDWEANGAPGEA